MQSDRPNVETQPDLTPERVGLPSTEEIPKLRRPRGFAAIDPTVRSAIASKGGRAAQAAGTAHRFTKEEARAAGKKGGNAPRTRRGGPRADAPTLPAPPDSAES